MYFHSLYIRLEFQNKKTHFKHVLVSFEALDIFFIFFAVSFGEFEDGSKINIKIIYPKLFGNFLASLQIQIKLINGPTCFSVSGTSRIQDHHETHPFHCTCKYCQWKKSQPTTWSPGTHQQYHQNLTPVKTTSPQFRLAKSQVPCA